MGQTNSNPVTLPSWLPVRRKREIAAALTGVLAPLKEHRTAHLSVLRQDWVKQNWKQHMESPAWMQVSTTQSSRGYRLVLGFKTAPCGYRSEDPCGLGCLNCGFYAGSGYVRANPEQILSQFRDALEQGFAAGTAFDVVEFLSDGSFLDDRQVVPEARERIFGFLRHMEYIERVLIEATPEHVSSNGDELRRLVGSLAPSQKLEVGIGLETSDDFIRRACINKGFSTSDFEQAVRTVAAVDGGRGKCGVVAYMLLKPAFLTLQEALQDSHRTMKYLSQLSRDSGVQIVPKLEPAAVAKGTVLSYLNELGDSDPLHYAPLNYWSVLEVLTRTYRDEECSAVFPHIRVGAREDMDDVLKMPAVYTPDGRYDQFDYVVYSAIQGFNRHRSLSRSYAVLAGAFPQGLTALAQPDTCLGRWAHQLSDQVAGDAVLDTAVAGCAIIDFLGTRRSELGELERSSALIPEVSFLRSSYRALDLMEGHVPDSLEVLRKVKKAWERSQDGPGGDPKEALAEIFLECFQREGLELCGVDVREVDLMGDGHLRCFFHGTDFVTGNSYPFWVRIPCKWSAGCPS